MDRSAKKNNKQPIEPEPDYLTDEELPENDHSDEEEESRGICAKIFCCCFGKRKISKVKTRQYSNVIPKASSVLKS